MLPAIKPVVYEHERVLDFVQVGGERKGDSWKCGVEAAHECAGGVVFLQEVHRKGEKLHCGVQIKDTHRAVVDRTLRQAGQRSRAHHRTAGLNIAASEVFQLRVRLF